MKINRLLRGYWVLSILLATIVFPIRSFGLQLSNSGGSSDLGSMLAAGEYTLAYSEAARSSGGIGGEDWRRVAEHQQRPGGMIQADFTSLINLIQTTVEPLSWEDAGGTGVITSFQNGVLIDVSGRLQFLGPSGTGNRGRSLLSSSESEVNLVNAAKMRFLSLPKLEAHLELLATQGQPIPDSLKYLGGMYEIQSIVVDRESQDLLLVGPAGPWIANEQGILVNAETGRPVLHLDDLVACLRNVSLGRGVLGCSIDPRPGQFKKAAELAAKWNLTVAQVRNDFLTAVGPQDTVVFGVPLSSHAAQVLLTADYHIKLLAMGNVKAGPRLPSYLDRCQADDPPTEIIRWWFTLGQPRISQSDDGSLYQIQGPVMELKTEAQLLAGRQAGQAPRSIAAEAFVADFNRQLPEVRRLFPVYGQLENIFNLSVLSQLLVSQGIPAEIGWNPQFLLGGPDVPVSYALRRYPEIREVQLVINHRTIRAPVANAPAPNAGNAQGGQANRQLLGNRQRQTIVAISGGVEVKTSAESIRGVMQSQATDYFPIALRQGFVESRTKLAAPLVGPTENPVPLTSRVWFHD